MEREENRETNRHITRLTYLQTGTTARQADSWKEKH